MTRWISHRPVRQLTYSKAGTLIKARKCTDRMYESNDDNLRIESDPIPLIDCILHGL